MRNILPASGLQKSLDKLGFNLVGFGCTTCIGNSGPLAPEISKTINDNGIVAAAVLSGNRNFEGRVSPDVQANYLASPPLVVAHATRRHGRDRSDESIRLVTTRRAIRCFSRTSGLLRMRSPRSSMPS